jgi:hypothetical protein
VVSPAVRGFEKQEKKNFSFFGRMKELRESCDHHYESDGFADANDAH